MSHSPIARQAMINNHSYTLAHAQETQQDKTDMQLIVEELEGVNKRVYDLKRNVMPIIQAYLANMRMQEHQ
jgi:hypothetical protein